MLLRFYFISILFGNLSLGNKFLIYYPFFWIIKETNRTTFRIKRLVEKVIHKTVLRWKSFDVSFY